MTRSGTLAFPAVLAAMFFCAAGCNTVPRDEYNKVSAELAQSQQDIKHAKDENHRLAEQVRTQQERIESLLALGDKRLDKLYYTRSISLGAATGGVSTEGKDGDNAVKIFIEPMDQYGSIIKAPGQVKVQLFDLAAPPDKNLLGQLDVSVDELAKLWSSGFIVYHYSFPCLFTTQPQHPDITVRVEFTDYLTGQRFSQQKVVKVQLRPTTQPATAASQSATAPASQPLSH